MAFFDGFNSQGYAHPPSAPPLTPSDQWPPPAPAAPPQASGFAHQTSMYHGYPPPPQPPFHGSGDPWRFPPGTNPEIIRSFQAVDRDGSGSIDENELRAALSSGYQRFSVSTIRLLMFLFQNPMNPNRIGPAEFSSLWTCLGHWRGIFERFDRDRSREIDSMELKDALLSIGYAVPPSVMEVIMSKFGDGSSWRGSLDFDSFVECGLIVKGLTEKFKERDPRRRGSATLEYEDFMAMVIPFIVT